MTALVDKVRPMPLLILDSIIWYFFLAILVMVSFQGPQFIHPSWLLVVSTLCALLAAHCLSIAFGGRCNFAALSSARFACALICAAVALLVCQLVLPYSTALHHDFILQPQRASALTWFSPNIVWSVVPKQTQWLLISEFLMLLVFIATLCLVSTRQRVKQLLMVLLLVGLVHALFGSLAKFSGLSFVDLEQLDGHFSAARGWFVNRNHFASFVSLTMVAGLTFLIKGLLSGEPSRTSSILVSLLRGPRAVLLLVLLISLVAIILSQSRAGFLGLVCVSWVPFLLLRKKSVSTRNWLYLGMLLLLSAGVVLWFFGGDLLERFAGDALTLGERNLQWEITWNAIQKEWLLGYGGNSYATVFQVERGYADLRQVVFDQSHNDYLHIWLEQGLLGLVLWLGLIGLTLTRTFKSFVASSSTLISASMLAIFLVMVAALLQAVVDFNLQIPTIRYYFFVLLALTFSIPTITQRASTKKRFLLV